MKRSNVLFGLVLVVALASMIIALFGVADAYKHKVPYNEEAGLKNQDISGFKKIRFKNMIFGNVKIANGDYKVYTDDEDGQMVEVRKEGDELVLDFKKSMEEMNFGRVVIRCPHIELITVDSIMLPAGKKRAESYNLAQITLNDSAHDSTTIELGDKVRFEVNHSSLAWLNVHVLPYNAHDNDIRILENNDIKKGRLSVQNGSNVELDTYIPDLEMELTDSSALTVSGKVEKLMMGKK